jgi:hypothetical protein
MCLRRQVMMWETICGSGDSTCGGGGSKWWRSGSPKLALYQWKGAAANYTPRFNYTPIRII